MDQTHKPSILGSTPWLLESVVGLLVLAAVANAIYNIFFHPLSKFPGSKTSAASNIPYWIATVRGNAVPWVRYQHEKYGEVVRIGVNKVSYINPQAWKDAFGHRTGGRLENTKDTRFYSPGQGGQHNILSVPDTEEHGRLRKIFSNAFSDRALRCQEPLITKYVDMLVEKLDRASRDPEHSKKPQDLVKLYNCATFDIIADLVFGESLGLLENEKLSPWVEAVFGNMRTVSVVSCIQDYPLLATFVDYLIPSKLKKQQELHFEYTNSRVDKRTQAMLERNDIWNFVMKKDGGKSGKLSQLEMYSNASVLMVGGSETTATLLSGITHLLLQNPDKLKKLIDEVRALPKELLNFDGVARLEYLRACFEEALRFYPPVPTALPREVPKGGNAIMGEWLPEGTSIYIPHQVAYHSSLNFKDPESFIPERWLPDSHYESDRKEILQPFSFGPRNCLGKNLAYHEMRIILAKVLWHFDLELCPESLQWFAQKTYILWDKSPLWVKVKPVLR